MSIYKHKFIVFAIDHFNSLGIIRSLGEKGINPIVVLYGEKSKLVQKSKYVSRIDSNLAYHAKNVISDLFDISDDKQKNQSSFNSTIKYQKRKISEMENLIDKNVTANIRCRQYLSKVNGK